MALVKPNKRVFTPQERSELLKSFKLNMNLVRQRRNRSAGDIISHRGKKKRPDTPNPYKQRMMSLTARRYKDNGDIVGHTDDTKFKKVIMPGSVQEQMLKLRRLNYVSHGDIVGHRDDKKFPSRPISPRRRKPKVKKDNGDIISNRDNGLAYSPRGKKMKRKVRKNTGDIVSHRDDKAWNQYLARKGKKQVRYNWYHRKAWGKKMKYEKSKSNLRGSTTLPIPGSPEKRIFDI